MGLYVRLEKALCVSSLCLGNRKCLLGADTWVRPYNEIRKRCMIASGGCVVCLHGAVEKEMELFV